MEVSRWALRTHSEMLTVLKTPHSLVMELSSNTVVYTGPGTFLTNSLVSADSLVSVHPAITQDVF